MGWTKICDAMSSDDSFLAAMELLRAKVEQMQKEPPAAKSGGRALTPESQSGMPIEQPVNTEPVKGDDSPATSLGHDQSPRAAEPARAAQSSYAPQPAYTPQSPRSDQPAHTPQPARATELLAGLNPAQRAAVEHSGGHLLVVAGAGSGKTRVLTTRIAYLIASGQRSPGEIMAITFTNKAAREMRERLEELLGPTARRMWISTFHSACVRILRAEHEALGMRSTFTIYDATDSQRLMKMVIQEDGIDMKAYPPKTLSRKVSDLKNEMVSPREFAERASDKDEQVLATAYAGYQRRLRAANAVDFDDLIMLTVNLLRNHPNIAEHYRRRFRHILVDEYQDTNTAQYQLVRELVGEETDAVHGELTVVGDADQSIYAFRGATIRNIEDFEKDFPNATSILLEQNYRSTQNILSAANAVIAHNQGRRPKRLWTDSGDGPKLIGYVADAESDESVFVVEEIDKLRAEHGYKYADFALFYRTNAQSRALEEMFVRSGIPYKVVGGTRFYERKEIKDALAYLQAVANPDDTVSIRRILNEPRRGLGVKAEESVAMHAQRFGVSFGQALADVAHPSERGEVAGLTARARNSMIAFVTLLEEVRAKAESGESPAELLDELMDRSGYIDVLQKSNDPQDESRLENLAEFHSVASDFRVLNPEGTLGDFLDQVSLVADSDQIPDTDPAYEGEVVLMTVHTAKGLEFPVVFVTGLEDGTFPHIRALASSDELAEERRLAYVALTRARERLYVSRAATRAQWGAPQELPRSRFLDEIPDEVIEWRREESAMDTLRGSGWGSSWGSTRSGNGYGRGGYGSDSYGRHGGESSYSWDDDDFAPAFGAGGGYSSAPGKKKFKAGKLLGEGTTAAGTGRSAVGAAQSAPQTAQTGPQSGSSQTPSAPSTGGIGVGDRVRHKSFGTGVVLSFEGTGKSTVAKVRFRNGAEKRLMLRFAPLEKI